MPAPTRVVLYSYADGMDGRAVGEFRWSPESGVSLVVHDPAQSRLAQDYFAHGIRSGTDRTVVSATDGPAFMRALLRPRLMRYSRFVDETRAGADPAEKACPTRNAVGFTLRRGGGRSAIAEAPIDNGDCIAYAWEIVRRTHRASAEDVSRVYCLWEPSERDKQFVARTFSGAALDHHFAHPPTG